MFADEEGQVFGKFEFEMRLEEAGQFLGAFHLITSADPMVPRRELIQPAEGCGQQKLSAGFDQMRDAFEKNTRVGQTAEQVGGQNNVELPEILPQIHGISRFEADPGRVNARRKAGGGGGRAVTLDGIFISERPARADFFRSRNEGVRKIDPDHFAAMAGQLEGGTSDRAADIEGAGIATDRGRIDQFAHAALGEAERVTRAVLPRENLIRVPVVEEQVFADLPVAFVDVVGHAGAAPARRAGSPCKATDGNP